MTDPVPRRDPFALAYAAVRERLRAGDIRPGEQIKIAEIAATLRLSATPVREALHRLVGEALVEDRRRLGYFAPSLRGRTLAELYGLYRLYIGAALARAGAAAGVPAGALPPAELFVRLLRASGDRSLVEAAARVAERLAPYAPAEARLIDTAAEERRLAGAAGRALEAAIDAYFEVRRRLSDAIAAEAEAPPL